MSARRASDDRGSTNDENVDFLRQAIMSQVRAEAEETIDEAEAQAEDLLHEAEREADDNRADILARAHEEAETIRAEAVAEAEIAAHQLQLKKREQLMSRVFQDARDQLPAVVTQPDYSKVLHRLTREALEHLSADEAVTRFDAPIREALGDGLEELLRDLEDDLGVEVSVGEPLRDKTGVLVRTTDGHRRYDNSLETRLRRMEPDLRAPVYHILVRGTP